jgi:pimeloyl-ACP methyl ester carboxylesterase
VSHRIHRTTSHDGTAIAGRVEGTGPPLVLVHGGGGNGEFSWSALLPFLTDRFTCTTMSTRGRGLSAPAVATDHRIDRLVDDVVAFAESLREPVGVVGYSSSITLAAAARSDAIAAVAVYEPGVAAVAPDDPARLADAVSRMMVAAAAGRRAEAVRIFFEDSGLFGIDEVAAFAASDAYGKMAENVPAWCLEMSEYAKATEASVLARVAVPVLLLRGSRTAPWFVDSIRSMQGSLADARVVEVEGAGHLGPALVPEGVAAHLARFFAAVHPAA